MKKTKRPASSFISIQTRVPRAAAKHLLALAADEGISVAAYVRRMILRERAKVAKAPPLSGALR